MAARKKKKPVERLYPPRPEETDLVIDLRIHQAMREAGTDLYEREVTERHMPGLTILTTSLNRAYNTETGEFVGHVKGSDLFPLPPNTAPIGETASNDMYTTEVIKTT